MTPPYFVALAALAMWAAVLPPAAAAPSKGAFLGIERPPAESGEQLAALPTLVSDAKSEGANLGPGETGTAWWHRGQQWLVRGSLAFKPSSLVGMWRTQHLGAQIPQEPERSPVEKATVMAVEIIVSWILLLGVAWLYIKYKPDPLIVMDEAAKQHPLDGEFTHSLFGCFWVPCMSLFVLTGCGQGIRWADTVRMLGALSFTSALITFGVVCDLGTICLELLPEGVSLPLCLLLVLPMFIYFRQELRKAFNMKTGPAAIALDCLSYTFCMPCAIVQDARQVEEAKILGHGAVSGAYPLSFF